MHDLTVERPSSFVECERANNRAGTNLSGWARIEHASRIRPSLYPLSMKHWLLTLALLLAIDPSLLAQLKDAYPVRTGEWARSLGGAWKFKYFGSSSLGADAAFYQPSFNAVGWPEIKVPSHWELAGFAPPKYKRVDEGAGLYRTLFRLPESYKGRRIFLRFEGVLYGFEVWINGVDIGSWASSYNPATFEITDSVKAGAENLLAVRVATRSKGYEFDQNDCWALSGIYRDVILFSTPQSYFEDFTARTTLDPDGSAYLDLGVQLGGITNPPSVAVTGQLLSPAKAARP